MSPDELAERLALARSTLAAIAADAQSRLDDVTDAALLPADEDYLVTMATAALSRLHGKMEERREEQRRQAR